MEWKEQHLGSCEATPRKHVNVIRAVIRNPSKVQHPVSDVTSLPEEKGNGSDRPTSKGIRTTNSSTSSNTKQAPLLQQEVNKKQVKMDEYLAAN